MKYRFPRRGLALALVLAMTLGLLVLPATAAQSYIVNGVAVPVTGKDRSGKTRTFSHGSATYGKGQCWAFSQMVYKKLWNGKEFTSYRGTKDDMLRNVATGQARAITAENTKNFITAAAPGAVIRIVDNINGADGAGTHKHSMILIAKDTNSLTLYDSVSSGVRIRTLTWKEFADKYQAKYKYFKYIKWPGAPAYTGKPTAPTGVTLTADQPSCAVGKVVVLHAGATDASSYTFTVSKGSSVVENWTVSNENAQLWLPTQAGTYTVQVKANNAAGSTASSPLTITVYDAKPSAPTVQISADSIISGQTVTLTWKAGKQAAQHSMRLLKDGKVYYTAPAGTFSYTASFPEGSYTAEATGSNPYGSATGKLSFQVKGYTASGKAGNNVTWTVNTQTGVLALSGTGATYDNAAPADVPYAAYKSSITHVIVGEGITSLGKLTLFGFDKVTQVDLPETLTYIGINNFSYFTALEEINIPYAVKKIDSWAFANCSKLKSVYFANTDLPELVPGNNEYGDNFSGCHSDLTLYTRGGMIIGFTNKYFKLGMVMGWVNVRFDGQGGDCPGNSDYINGIAPNPTHNYGTLPTPTRRGYTFDGWYTEPVGGTKITASSTVTRPYSHTLYAHWTPQKFNVSFDALEGQLQGAASKLVSFWDTYGTLPDAERGADGPSVYSLMSADAGTYSVDLSQPVYVFDGWYTAEDGGQAVTDSTLVDLAQAQTLYAHWDEYDIQLQSGWICDGTISYDLSQGAYHGEAYLMVAYYDAEGRFLGCVPHTINLAELEGYVPDPYSGTYATCKLFLCSKNLAPVCTPIELRADAVEDGD